MKHTKELDLTQISEEDIWQLYCLAMLVKNSTNLKKSPLQERAITLINKIDGGCMK